MLVNIGNVTAFPDARADGVQGAKVLEEAAEVFCAWQDYDKSVFLANDRDNHTATRKCLDSWVDADRDNLLYELSDLLMACENMLAGLDARRKGEFECEVATLTKESVRRVLVLSSVVHHLSSKWSGAKAAVYRIDLMDNVRALEELACSIVAALGVTDFRPWMEACERRNMERGRYDVERADQDAD